MGIDGDTILDKRVEFLRDISREAPRRLAG